VRFGKEGREVANDACEIMLGFWGEALDRWHGVGPDAEEGHEGGRAVVVGEFERL
jgi:hypothetical protein